MDEHDSKNDLSPLHVAAKEGDIDTVKMLIDAAQNDCCSSEDILSFVCPLITRDNIGTPLSLAASEGHWEIVDILSSLYSDSTPEETGYALYKACSCRQMECIKILVDRFPQHVNSPHEKFEFSLIHNAAKENETEVLKVLLQAGANANVKLKDGRTALHFAALHGHEDSVKILLSSGADPCLTVKVLRVFFSDKNSLAIAAEMGHLEIVKILAQVTPKDLGLSAIFHSALNQRNQCLKYLVENGFLTSIQLQESGDRNFWNCLLPEGHYYGDQYLNNFPDTIEILLENGMFFRSLAEKERSYASAPGGPLICEGDSIMPVAFKNYHINILRIFLNHGLLELRYLCSPFPNAASTREPLKAIQYWLLIYSSPRHQEEGLSKLKLCLDHFPFLTFSSHSGKSDFGKRLSDAEMVPDVPSLTELCRWIIRCSVIRRHGLLHAKVARQLPLPESLKKYILYKGV